MKRGPYKLSKFEKMLMKERESYKSSYPPTDDMKRRQAEYFRDLEERKTGKAPLFRYADGREYR